MFGAGTVLVGNSRQTLPRQQLSLSLSAKQVDSCSIATEISQEETGL